MEHRSLTTSDGHRLAADLDDANSDVSPARGAVVVCHPHPLYGGDRHNPVVDAVFRALPTAGFHVLRFDFRADHADGVGERLDVVAALDTIAERHPGQPLHLVGYSFGAVVALTTADDRVVSIVAIAPPLTAMPIDQPPQVPTLVLTPEHDQFCPPEAARPVVSSWPDVQLDVVAMADHFVTGRAAAAADAAVVWLSVPRAR